jgi:hypothetical protein
MAGAGCMMLSWRRLLADLGSPLPVPVAARVTFVAQLGKYVPGAVWSFAAHVELGHDYEVPRRRGAASVLIGLAVAVAVGLLIAAVSLPLASPHIARRYLPFLLAVPLIAACLVPPIMHKLLNRALKIIRQEPLERAVSWRGLSSALAWTVVGWLLLGMQVWLLLADVAGHSIHSLLIAVGAYALACSLALLLVIFPNGVGAREIILVAALAPVLPHGAAFAIALITRAVTTLSDLAWGGIALGLAKSAASTASLRSGRHVGRHRKAPTSSWQTAEPESLAQRRSAAADQSSPPAVTELAV